MMNQPKDYSAATTIGWVRVARIFSNVVSPPVIIALLGLALSLKELPNLQGLMWALLFGFWVSLMPILLVVYLLKTGRITDLHMNTRRERRLPYITGVVGALVALLVIEIFSGPDLLRCLAIYSVIALSFMAIITHYWMISIHASSVTAATIIAGLVFGLWIALLLLPLVVLVSWVRIYLRRHTGSQVLAGIALGGGIVLVMAIGGCFV